MKRKERWREHAKKERKNGEKTRKKAEHWLHFTFSTASPPVN